MESAPRRVRCGALPHFTRQGACAAAVDDALVALLELALVSALVTRALGVSPPVPQRFERVDVDGGVRLTFPAGVRFGQGPVSVLVNELATADLEADVAFVAAVLSNALAGGR